MQSRLNEDITTNKIYPAFIFLLGTLADPIELRNYLYIIISIYYIKNFVTISKIIK